VVLSACSILWAIPFVTTITNSFMSAADISAHYSTSLTVFDVLQKAAAHYVDITLIPTSVTIRQYLDALVYQPAFIMMLGNSLQLTLPVVAGNCLVSLLAAYGLRMWQAKIKHFVFNVYVLVMFMPLQAVLVPNYIVAGKLGIKDSYLAIILPGVFAPFGVFLLYQYLRSLPDEAFEAASMDGAGKLRMFVHIVLPNLKSGIAALCILNFIDYWNVVDQAVVFIRDSFKQPLSTYLANMSNDHISTIFAASCIYMVLPLLFLLTFQKELESGICVAGLRK